MTEETSKQSDFEERLPAWQRQLNLFCENWIFALLLAMCFKGLLIDMYQIPTASMEPMLYGDADFFKGDKVVVNKLSNLWHTPTRWDVTVFHYPVPELAGPGNAPLPAVGVNGERRDHWLSAPLLHRNFVKRLVGMPGDTFYISGGDYYRKDESGNFTVPEKPSEIQEDLWVPMYQHGAAKGYLPWNAGNNSVVELSEENTIIMDFLAESEPVRFTQPLINLWAKPGMYRAQSLAEAGHIKKGAAFPGQEIEVSMLQPEFPYKNNAGQEMTGNIWHLDTWKIARVTTADLDSNRYGAILNDRMRELVGDVRVSFTLEKILGEINFRLEEQGLQGVELRLNQEAWSLHSATDEKVVLAEGKDALINRKITLIHVDNIFRMLIDDEEQVSVPTLPSDPMQNPTSLTWNGQGSAVVNAFSLDRDVHYSIDGFLVDYKAERNSTLKRLQLGAQKAYLDQVPADRAANEIHIQQMAESLYRHKMAELEQNKKVREQLLQLGDGALQQTDLRAWESLASSPETAATIPPEAYLLLGDNSPFSLDGRSWGYVPETNIRGRVSAVIFPFDRVKFVR